MNTVDRILLVEDDPRLAEMLTEYLTQAGFRVTHAPTGGVAMERIAAAEGYTHLYLSVDPLANPRAYALYQRLGYQQIQVQPYRKTWAFTDSAGQVHRGEDWLVDMRKPVQG